MAIDPQSSATPEGTTPEAGTPPVAATVPEVQAPPPEPKGPDWKKAYESEQRATSRHARRMDELQQSNAALVEAMSIIRRQQESTLKATLPPEQASAIIAESAAAETSVRQKSQTEQLLRWATEQQRIFQNTVEAFGIDPKSIDWAPNATSVDEWSERVSGSIRDNVGKAREGLLQTVDKGVAVKVKEEKARLADETRKALKEAGIDKIDTAQGSPSTFASRLATMDPNSKEFAALTQQALDGRLKGIK